MIVAIQQPEHLPWIGFFDKMIKCDAYVFLDNVQYKKRYFENRNKIINRDGQCQWITVPVISKGKYHQKISDVIIDNASNWQRKYLENIKRAYTKTIGFKDNFLMIEKIIRSDFKYLINLNIALINYYRNYYQISTPCYFASELIDDHMNGSDLILQLCKSTKATKYLSGPDGRNYLKTDTFDTENIEIEYHDYQHPVYEQLYCKTFSSHMSICDYTFNNGENLWQY